MTATRSRWTRSVPVDLLGVVIVVILANVAVFHPTVSESPLRLVTGILFVLFVPGYALVSALFPEAGHAPKETRANVTHGLGGNAQTSKRGLTDLPRGVDRWERLALSFVLSLAVVPLLAMGVTLSALSFTTLPLFLTISTFTVLCVVIAMARRLRLPPQKRFHTSVVGGLARSLTEVDSRGEILLNIALVVAILFAAGTFGFAVLSPADGETYTEFYVLSEDEDGDLVAAEYPDSFIAEEPQQVHTGIENYEGETVEYEVIVQLQRVEESDQGVEVAERHEMDRFSVMVEPDESWVDERDLTAPAEMEGTDRRIAFMLYKDSVPETPTSDTAYRNLHLWIDIEGTDQQSTTPGDAETTG